MMGREALRTPTPSKLGLGGAGKAARGRWRLPARREAPPRGLELEPWDPDAACGAHERGGELRDSGSLCRSPHCTAEDTGNAPSALLGPPPTGWRLCLLAPGLGPPLGSIPKLHWAEVSAPSVPWGLGMHQSTDCVLAWAENNSITDCERAPCWILPWMVALVLKEPDPLLTGSMRQISSEEVSLRLIFTFGLSPELVRRALYVLGGT